MIKYLSIILFLIHLPCIASVQVYVYYHNRDKATDVEVNINNISCISHADNVYTFKEFHLGDKITVTKKGYVTTRYTIIDTVLKMCELYIYKKNEAYYYYYNIKKPVAGHISEYTFSYYFPSITQLALKSSGAGYQDIYLIKDSADIDKIYPNYYMLIRMQDSLIQEENRLLEKLNLEKISNRAMPENLASYLDTIKNRDSILKHVLCTDKVKRKDNNRIKFTSKGEISQCNKSEIFTWLAYDYVTGDINQYSYEQLRYYPNIYVPKLICFLIMAPPNKTVLNIKGCKVIPYKVWDNEIFNSVGENYLCFPSVNPKKRDKQIQYIIDNNEVSVLELYCLSCNRISEY